MRLLKQLLLIGVSSALAVPAYALGERTMLAKSVVPTETVSQTGKIGSTSLNQPDVEKGDSNTLARPSTTTKNDTSCEVVLKHFNQASLQGQVNTEQLVEIVRTLNQYHRLPDYFVTKKQARQLGWQPGVPFNRIPALQGKSIGGDRFGNYEQRLPSGDWKEADLDYQGGKRNAKRMVFSYRGDQYVTIDHYEQFHKVPVCQ